MLNDDIRFALDPLHSAVIQACAGSGKTWMLVSRIIRLLLAGVAPDRILAITFTRKAQQEMAVRLYQWLKEMATMEDDALTRFLVERGMTPGEARGSVSRARALFETCGAAGRTPVITTFHGLFLQLLHGAPLLSVHDGSRALVTETGALREAAWRRLALDVHAGAGRLAADMAFLQEQLGPYKTRELLDAFLERRAEWWAFAETEQGADGSRRSLAAGLGVGFDDPRPELVGADDMDALLSDFADLLARNEQGADAARVARARLCADPVERFEILRPVFLTVKGEARSRRPSGAQARRLGEEGERRYLRLHDDLGARFERAVRDRDAWEAVRLNDALLTCGQHYLAGYQAAKDDRRVVDFADLEWQAVSLLSGKKASDAMVARLGERYRHVLIDEFQDTNPLQWRALRAWLEAARYAGANLMPGVMLVGDPKQSIYRFRRADPRLFDLAADYLAGAYGARLLRQNESFRCARHVLDGVNRVFGGDQPLEGFETHASRAPAQWSRVEVLPLVSAAAGGAADVDAGAEALRDPLARGASGDDDLRRLAEGEMIAARLKEMVGRWRLPDGRGGWRPMRHSDVLLLVRKRTNLDPYEQALRRAQIPFVSCRGGGLMDALECQDVMALLRYLYAPYDSLSLAQVLRSPLFGLHDDALMALALQPQDDWHARLKAAADGNAALDFAWRRLEDWRAQAQRKTVHELLDRIYADADVVARYRQAVPAWLADAVAANLNAMMERSLMVGSGRTGLLYFIEAHADAAHADDGEAPDAGQVAAPDAVQIMTIHGAKGLEAPVLWLIDANTAGKGMDEGGVLMDWPPEAARPRHFSVHRNIGKMGGMGFAVALDEARGRAREERNLLYVAMTRARHVFLVSGIQSRRGGGATPYQSICEALELPAAGPEAPWSAGDAPVVDDDGQRAA